MARDNTGVQCGACQAKRRDVMLAAPVVPPEFWAVDQMRDALASWHMGKVIAAYRNHPHHGRPISQEVVGGWVNLTQAQLSRIETGSPIKDLDRLVQWARLLRIPPQFLWFRLPSGTALQLQEPATPPPPCIPAQLSVALPTSPSGLVAMGNGAVLHGGSDASAMQAFRAADKQVGGGHLYATVVKYLHTEVAPRLFGSEYVLDDQLAFNGAAALTEMADWMAHDAGHDQAAKRHFSRAHYLVQVGGDRQLGAHVLASLSHLAHHLDQPTEAVQFASRGRLALKDGPPQPELEARLLAMHARGFAALREPDECVRLLVQAEQALGDTPTEEPSPWISGFDEASLASEAARCMRQLGDLNEAQRQMDQRHRWHRSALTVMAAASSRTSPRGSSSMPR
ncbi:MAG: helix-turn-helix domain-containing protein [Pseudonocardiaceae bacterium]